MRVNFQGLYAIADTSLIPEEMLVEKVALALYGGACLVQYRDKGTDPGHREWQAVDLLHLCNSFKVPLLINDDVELAAKIGAAGVHLGQNDMPVAHARALLGPSALIGVSCHDDLSLALQAERDGASYVAFGRFFPSHTKPFAIQANPDLLTDAKKYLQVPLAAIGGITPDNAKILLAAGADLLAVIHGLFAQGNVRAAASQFSRLFIERDSYHG
ncbi:Thiamine-phosphate synthase [Gammaproteobacteria bacterium]